MGAAAEGEAPGEQEHHDCGRDDAIQQAGVAAQVEEFLGQHGGEACGGGPAPGVGSDGGLTGEGECRWGGCGGRSFEDGTDGIGGVGEVFPPVLGAHAQAVDHQEQSREGEDDRRIEKGRSALAVLGGEDGGAESSGGSQRTHGWMRWTRSSAKRTFWGGQVA